MEPQTQQSRRMSVSSSSRAPSPQGDPIEDVDGKANSQDPDDMSKFNSLEPELALQQETNPVDNRTEPDRSSEPIDLEADLLTEPETLNITIEDREEEKELAFPTTEDEHTDDKLVEEGAAEPLKFPTAPSTPTEEETSPKIFNLSPSTPSKEVSAEIQDQHISITSPSEMEEEAVSNQLECLNIQESDLPKSDAQRVIMNNENETDALEPSPGSKTAPRSGIRPPTAVIRPPKPAVVPPSPVPRPTTTPARSTIASPRVVASPRPASKMSRERSDVLKSTSTRSINDVGRFTPKVNAKFVNVKSKVGSVTNHKPGGGNVEIFSEKKEYSAQSKVGSLKNANHVAGGGNVQIESRKLDFTHASPKVGSKTNYVPVKSDVKIVSEKLTWNAKSKVGSMDNAAHKPTGGNVQILSQKLNWKAESKVGSKDNMSHRPGGGNVKIFDEKIHYVSDTSSRNHSRLDISSL